MLEQARQETLKHFVVSAGVFARALASDSLGRIESLLTPRPLPFKNLLFLLFLNYYSFSHMVPRSGEPCRIRHFFARLQTAKLLQTLLPSLGRQGSRLLATLERFRDSHFTDRITYRQSVKLIRNLEFRASSAQLYVYVWRTPW